jgi:hypothetical protein
MTKAFVATLQHCIDIYLVSNLLVFSSLLIFVILLAMYLLGK